MMVTDEKDGENAADTAVVGIRSGRSFIYIGQGVLHRLFCLLAGQRAVDKVVDHVYDH